MFVILIFNFEIRVLIKIIHVQDVHKCNKKISFLKFNIELLNFKQFVYYNKFLVLFF